MFFWLLFFCFVNRYFSVETCGFSPHSSLDSTIELYEIIFVNKKAYIRATMTFPKIVQTFSMKHLFPVLAELDKSQSF